ncbi:uncharacterized protein L969DRAFT_77077 [Mixia osmundae IAM 14324]|uniref:GST C-terminal domain-containing protein n=1 Tax=Mixia osmundae (strain CBS 9802 / IAM 14324 / JCM 22182 / KY 12970) TaxID=764103 RepID=G7DSM3_MIXOS|nr:uncharacterized protein L969DRAFT_77077 [Mixia osmundae IAM 14324]KEI37921.1 hypothetical protein L969DRAFT_77077 [Mixia osmundae IAM 14324]GAA93583.1 hypothetical protein E5Q_00227 [Mixia osmundae IAM 14324]
MAPGITSWASKDGDFKRQESQFRDAVEPNADAKFPAEKGRYHLYVSLACPWATRALIVRKLKGLEDFFDVSVVHPFMGEKGWSFGADKYEGQGSGGEEIANVTGDKVYGFEYIRELYFKADPKYSARFTVPVFWDKKQETLVSNESSEIIRFMNTAFNDKIEGKHAKLDLYPQALRKEIDELNDPIYNKVNNGVYKSGFATTQKAYSEAVHPLFEQLDKIEKILDGHDFLVGDQLTEADVRLWVTLIRFDPVYVGHFKCNIRTIRAGYPNINRYMKNLYHNYPAFRDSTDFTHIKVHYYTSHPQVNPTRIVPEGPIPHIEPM